MDFPSRIYEGEGSDMKKMLFAVAAMTALSVGNVSAYEYERSEGNFGRLDHVFFIMMENQTNTDILATRTHPLSTLMRWSRIRHQLLRGWAP